MDENIYLNRLSPTSGAFRPVVPRPLPPQQDRGVRRQGRGDEMVADTRDLQAILASKGSPRGSISGPRRHHDWPWWRRQLPYFLGTWTCSGAPSPPRGLPPFRSIFALRASPRERGPARRRRGEILRIIFRFLFGRLRPLRPGRERRRDASGVTESTFTSISCPARRTSPALLIRFPPPSFDMWSSRRLPRRGRRRPRRRPGGPPCHVERPRRETVDGRFPRVREGLLEAEGEAPVRPVEARDRDFDCCPTERTLWISSTLSHPISEMGSSPSIGPTETKAPNSRTEVTVPVITIPP